MKVVILAAGLGTRLEELGKSIPKCLIKVNKKSILEQQLELLRELGLKDITVVIGGEGECWTSENQEKIRKMVPLTIINPENKKKNNSYSLKLFLNNLKKEDLLILDGDILFNKAIIERIVHSNRNEILTKEVENNILTNRVSTGEDSKVTSVIRSQGDNPAHGGIIKITKDDLNLVKELIEEGGYSVDLTYMLNELSKRRTVYSTLSDEITNVNTKEDLEATERNINNNFAVIWDFDGVIFNSAPFKIEAYKRVLKRIGINMLDSDFHENNGLGGMKALEKICSKYKKTCDIKELYLEKEKIYLNLISQEISPMLGAEKLIQELSRKGYKQAIATSTSRRNLLLILEKFAIRNYFDVLITGEDLIKGKPDPEPFIKAAEKLNIKRENCIVIEDSIYGVEAAKEAGMGCIALTAARVLEEDLGKADLIVPSLEELDESIIRTLY